MVIKRIFISLLVLTTIPCILDVIFCIWDNMWLIIYDIFIFVFLLVNFLDYLTTLHETRIYNQYIECLHDSDYLVNNITKNDIDKRKKLIRKKLKKNKLL